jgi:nucleoid-associated protein YgaU
MKKGIFICGTAVMAAVICGCKSPELEKTPYGQDEVRWEGFIKSNYPNWQGPQSVPPSATGEVPPMADLPALPALTEPVIIETPAVSSHTTYTIEKGDTLWGISKKFYGKGGNWQQILDANTDKITDPNKLKMGTVINIPPKP